MKKIIKNNLLGFVLGIILCSGIVYGVNNYQSNSIEYTPSDETWDVSNVNDAINSLYSTFGSSKPVELKVVSTLSKATATSKSFTPTQDTKSIIIGGRRYGGAFTATIKDSDGNVIASELITAVADYGGVNYASAVDLKVVNCELEKGKTYTLNVPTQGSAYALFAFVIYP